MNAATLRLREPASYQGTLSDIAVCLTELGVKAISRKPTIAMILRTPISYDYRKMVLVQVRDTLYWTDRATGTLYEPGTGRCLSTPSLHLLFQHAGETFETMLKFFPGLQKSHPEAPKAKTGPKPKGYQAESGTEEP